MSREIEFRVWDLKLKKMMPWNPCIAFDDPEYKIMQYIGLKDVTGQKIFEGDVIEYRKRGGIIADASLYKSEIYLGSYGTCLKLRECSEEFVNPWNFLYPTFIIVGNIYETV